MSQNNTTAAAAATTHIESIVYLLNLQRTDRVAEDIIDIVDCHEPDVQKLVDDTLE